jgi:large subunit ribosomal protein L25
MQETFQIDAKSRADAGKGASRRLRGTGMVPGIVYGGHKEPVMIAIKHNELAQHLEHEAFYSHVLKLNLDGATESVVLKDLQRHPAKPFVTHIDFQRISAAEKIRMLVPLHFTNESKCVGLKKGGAATHNINEIEITCLPKDLPEFIEVDMSELDTGMSVHVGELVMPEGVELVHTLDPHAPVVSVHGAHGMDEADEEGEAAEE